MKTLRIDDKWSVEYDPANNDRPINWVWHSGEWDANDAVTAMFYALLGAKPSADSDGLVERLRKDDDLSSRIEAATTIAAKDAEIARKDASLIWYVEQVAALQQANAALISALAAKDAEIARLTAERDGRLSLLAQTLEDAVSAPPGLRVRILAEGIRAARANQETGRG